MALSSPGMSQNGVKEERGTRTEITICGAGAKTDVVIALKETDEDQETVQSNEKENVVTAIDPKMAITQMVTTQNRTTEGSLGKRRKAKPSCSGVCLLMSLRMIFVLPLINWRGLSQWMSG